MRQLPMKCVSGPYQVRIRFGRGVCQVGARCASGAGETSALPHRCEFERELANSRAPNKSFQQLKLSPPKDAGETGVLYSCKTSQHRNAQIA